MAEQGFEVIAVSPFGGFGTPLPADASALAQADACLLDALGIDRVAALGASAGAPSTQFALRHPERSAAMVLLVPAAYVLRPDGAPPLRTPRGTQFLFDTALRFDCLSWAAPWMVPRQVMRAILATPPDVVASASTQEHARVARMMNQILPVSPRRSSDSPVRKRAVTASQCAVP